MRTRDVDFGARSVHVQGQRRRRRTALSQYLRAVVERLNEFEVPAVLRVRVPVPVPVPVPVGPLTCAVPLRHLFIHNCCCCCC